VRGSCMLGRLLQKQQPAFLPCWKRWNTANHPSSAAKCGCAWRSAFYYHAGMAQRLASELPDAERLACVGRIIAVEISRLVDMPGRGKSAPACDGVEHGVLKNLPKLIVADRGCCCRYLCGRLACPRGLWNIS